MSFLTLGLLKGIGDGYSQYAEAKRKQEADAKAAAAKSAREDARLEREYELKEDLARFEAGVSVTEEQRKSEQAIATTFGYMTEEGQPAPAGYTGKTRLPTFQERQNIISKNLKAGTPMFAPSGYNLLGYADAMKNRGISDIGHNAYIQVEDTTMPGAYNTIPIPIAPIDKGTEGERARQNIQNAMGMLSSGNYLKQIMIEEKNGDPNGNFKRIKDAFTKNGGQLLLQNYLIAENKQTGESSYSDPLALFNIDEHIKDPTTKKWFIDNIVQPTIGWSVDVVYELAGVDNRIPYTRQELRNNILLRDKKKYERFLGVDDNGKPKIYDEIYNPAKQISDTTGMRIQDVMGFVSRSNDPEKSLKGLLQDAKFFNDVVIDSSKPTIEISVEAETELAKLYDKYGVETLEDKKKLVRMMLKRVPHGRANKSVKVDSSGNRSLVYTDRQKNYQINPQEARAEAKAARDAHEIIGNMLLLHKRSQGARAGFTGSVINFSAGIQTIAEGLTEIISNVSMKDDQRAAYMRNIEEFRKFDFLGVSENQQTSQRLFDLLGEQLAFAMAAAAQNGASGRAISDRDVEAWRNKLGLRGPLMSDNGVRKNLEYLQYEMEKSMSFNGDYAKAQSRNDFLATYIVDQTTRTNRTIEQIVFNAQYDARDKTNKQAVSAATSKAPRMMVNPDGTVRKVAPKD